MPERDDKGGEELGHGAPTRDDIARIWADTATRRQIVLELARSVSKTGSFGLTPWLAYLSESKTLSSAEVVELYSSIRRETGRLEPEWRGEFILAFPESATCLPSVSLQGLRYYWEEKLFYAILVRADARDVDLILAELNSHGVQPTTLTRLDIKSLQTNDPLWNNDPNDPESMSFVQFAEAIGNSNAAESLRSAGVR